MYYFYMSNEGCFTVIIHLSFNSLEDNFIVTHKHGVLSYVK